MKLNMQLKPEALKTVWSPHDNIYLDDLGVPLKAPDAARMWRIRAEELKAREDAKEAERAARANSNSRKHRFTRPFRSSRSSTVVGSSAWNYANNPLLHYVPQEAVGQSRRRTSDATQVPTGSTRRALNVSNFENSEARSVTSSVTLAHR
ncbi:hypothetical protein BABINDRAFT_167139 [Babjeviella inositovora NRRL Y-12698]|uniref:Uncharacterized protein n=1 Tax=Babjeviella inositovora NRRL Y-12698 TaxID=984486 RepID=A0A1E3QRC8_9ASCO|nr:uncharacterized protein BABINDRAFT_167139 [Babjeviella inositovora NRRL Y-12698]ODQ80044.1 hypothetical protein BABINDRAFT_167139 [Babjeviella inositovora NRRL Y-12698]